MNRILNLVTLNIKTLAIIALLAILFIPNTEAADWDPHPFNQGCYYQVDLSWSENYNIIYRNADSIKIEGNVTSKYLNSKFTHPDIAHCQDEILAFEPSFYPPIDFYITIDSLEYEGDLIRYINNETGDAINFFPLAQLGDEWFITFSDPNLVVDSILITCSSIQIENFFGLTDSVKTFTLTPNQGNTNIDDVIYKLSKNYGWIRYTPFSYFWEQNISPLNYQLIGLTDMNDSYGFQQHNIEEYFPYNQGDILFWKSTTSFFYTPYGELNYYLDSINTVTVTSQQISYQYSRTVFDEDYTFISYNPNASRVINYEPLLKIISTEPEKFSVGNYANLQELEDVEYLWFINPISFNLDEVSVTFSAQSKFFHNSINIDNCTIGGDNDYSEYSFALNTKKGIVSNGIHLWDIEENLETLEAAKIDGEQFGTIPLLSGIDDIVFVETLQIHPNPVSAQLYFDTSLISSEMNYEILDLNGNLLLSGNFTNNTIQVSELATGIYLLQFKNDNKTIVSKFLKQ